MSYRKNLSKIFRQSYLASTSNRTLGDTARDQKDWSRAAVHYRQHLANHSEDQPIWVQLGHMLKEDGNSELALEAYRKSLAIDPTDVETYRHLIHLLNSMGNNEEAITYLKKVVDFAPLKIFADALKDAHTDIPLLRQMRQYGKWIIEIDDILDYLRNHKTPSGIQRVQIGIISSILSYEEAERSHYSFVRTGRNAAGFWRIPNKNLLHILEYITLPEIEQEQLTSKIIAAEENAEFIEPQTGQFYLILGAFWGFGANAARYVSLKRSGVSIGVYLYDTIPISNPEYCSAGLVSEFTLALGDGFHSFDFIFTISRFVADDVKALMAKHNLPDIPTQPVLLAHQLHSSGLIKSPQNTRIWGGKIQFLKNKNFILMVSTIEARKNHVYLYNVWKELLDTIPDMPHLVFVGRFGWRMNDFRAMLEDTDFLDERIHVLHDISDTDLETLYNACQFTVFPSMVEGWGLPVGESLAHGRPCVASSTSSVPEVGGDLVDYIDPLNTRSGIAGISKMILQDDYRLKRAEQIKQSFVPRTWQDVTADMIMKLKSLKAIGSRPAVPPLLKAGEIFEPAKYAVGEKISFSYLGRPLRPIMAESWYPFERNLGAWMKGKDGFLEFSSSFECGSQIGLLLEIMTPPWAEHTLQISIIGSDNQSEKVILSPNHETSILVDGQVGSNKTVIVHFHIIGPTIGLHSGKSTMDTREFYFGLKRMVYFSKEE